MTQITVGKVFLDNLRRTVAAKGVHLQAVIDIDEHELLAAADLGAAWEEAVQLTGDDHLGLHLGEQSTTGRWGIVEQLLAQCQSLDDAMRLCIKYWRLVGFSDLNVGYDIGSDLAAIHLHTSMPMRHIAESDGVYMLRMMRMLLGTDFQLRELSFMHEQPADIGEHIRIFGVTPRFAQPRTSFVFDACWARGERLMDESIRQLLTDYAERKLAALGAESDLIKKISLLLDERHNLTAAEVATELNLSTRSLQNHLDKEGTSYSELKDERRMKQVKAMLSDGVTLGEIAFATGFADASSLSHFCKRVLGKTPTQLREDSAIGDK